MTENDIPRIMESRHVTFDESKFPGAPGLADFMDDEDVSDENFESEIGSGNDSGSTCENESLVSVDDFDNEFNQDDAILQDSQNLGISESDSDGQINNADDSNGEIDDAGDLEIDDTNDLEIDQVQVSGNSGSQDNSEIQFQYPRRNRRKPPKWYMATSAETKIETQLTTSDDPTLREAMSATPEERNLWQSAIDADFASLESKQTWKTDDSPGSQPLPTHVVLKIKRQSNGSIDRFKARVVAGGNFQTYGED